MTYQDALTTLRGHANLNGESGEPGLAAELWEARRSGAFPDIAPHIDALLNCLSAVNQALNGQRPSETFERQNVVAIADVGYCVSSLLVDLLRFQRGCDRSDHFSASQLTQLRDATLQLAMAWDMVLAGDHDDLREELALEWNATA
jgi:hypothetical protein